MAMLQIRDLDDDVREALNRRAREHHRSASAEAATILADAVGLGADRRDRRRQLLDAIAQHAAAWPRDLPAAEDLIAADRAR